MDLYVVDRNWHRQYLFDGYSTVIWTERYNQFGDITITFSQNDPLTGVLVEGTFVACTESDEIMLLNTVSIEKGIVTVVGKSLIDFLLYRMFRDTWNSNNGNKSYISSSGVAAIAAQIVSDMVIAGGPMSGSTVIPNGSHEVISGLSIGATATGSAVVASVTYGDLYSAVKSLCDLDSVGFTMRPPVPLVTPGTLEFITYKGLDRTSFQSTNPVVIFEEAIDTFADTKSLRSIDGYRNAAYAFPSNPTSQSQMGSAFIDNGATANDFSRRTLYVDASDIDPADYTSGDLITALNQKAKNGLVNNNYVRMVDGTIVEKNSQFKYGSDYKLGDIIELRGSSNIAQKAQVTEYIRSIDATGEAAYPTLSVVT